MNSCWNCISQAGLSIKKPSLPRETPANEPANLPWSRRETIPTLRQGEGREPDARAVSRKLITEGPPTGNKPKTFIHVNNRLEGNALETIDAMLFETA